MDISVALFTCSTLTCVSSLLGSKVVIQSELSWIEANNFCQTQYGGKVVSGEEAYNVEADISAVESFWTRDFGVLSQWFTIKGCYQQTTIGDGDVLHTIIYNDNIVARCARHCLKNSTRYFALQNTTCFCLSDVTSLKVDPFRCNLSCDGNNERYLCGGPNLYTVYGQATQTPNTIATCAADPTKCNCMAAQCLSSDVEYYSENCSSLLAASCNEGGFRYIVNNGRTQYGSWYSMLGLCISGQVNRAPSSYLDSLEDRAARASHCNGNPNNPNTVWTGTIRRFLSLTDSDTFDEDEENIACSYCIQSRGTLSCQNYYIGKSYCLNADSRLQFICKYDSPQLGSTQVSFTSVSTSRSTELLISKSTTPKGQCNSNLTSVEGNFTNPGNQSEGGECSWLIDVGSSGHIVDTSVQILLTIIDLKGQTCEDCTCDYIKIRDGGASNANIIGTYCPGMSTPIHVLASGEKLIVTYKQSSGAELNALSNMDENPSERGFNISYITVNGCGGLIQGMNGTIFSPMVDGSYPNNANCTYVIQQPEGYRTLLKVDTFLLQEFELGRCADVVEISNLFEDVDIGAYCGEIDPFSVISTSNVLVIRFRADSSMVSDGFIMHWERIEDCGGVYNDNNGTFNSIPYWDSYPLNADCTYRFIQPPGKRVILHFTLFDLPSANRGSSCLDFVEIYVANSLSANSVLRYCGQMTPFSIMSTDTEMAVRFKSDFLMDLNMGFVGTYAAVDISTLFDGYQGSFSIPRFSNTYPLNANISFSFLQDTGSSIILTFPVFNFQEKINETCQDYLKIGPDKLCGEMEPFQYIMSSQINSLDFISDIQQSDYGTDIMYDVCNVTIQDRSGTIRSPGFPVQYPSDAYCVYEIPNPMQNTISINFTYVNLPLSTNGSCGGYLKIYNSNNSAYRFNDSVEELCGNVPSFIVELNDSSIRLHFMSGNSEEMIQNGFMLYFSFIEDDIISPETTDDMSSPKITTTGYLMTSSTRKENSTDITTTDAIEGFWNLRIILLFVAVGLVLIIVTGVLIIHCVKRSREANDEGIAMRERRNNTVPRPIPSSDLTYV